MAHGIKRVAQDLDEGPYDLAFDLFAAASDSSRLSSLLSRAQQFRWTDWDPQCPLVKFLGRTFYFATKLHLVVIQEYLRNPSLRQACLEMTPPVPDDSARVYDAHLLEAAKADDLRLVVQSYSEGARNSRHGSFPITTALHAAAKLGSRRIVHFILAQGEDPNPQDATNKSRTALHVAVQNGDPAIVELLLHKRADVHLKDADGCTALCYAEIAEDPTHCCVEPLSLPSAPRARVVHETSAPISTVAESLLELGADIDAQDRDGMTILHRASLNGAWAVVRELSRRGADVRIQSNRGYDPLYCALVANHANCAVELLEQRANIASRHDIPGYTDDDLAPALLPAPQPSIVPGIPPHFLSEEWRCRRADCVQVVLVHEHARLLSSPQAVEQAATNNWPLAPRLLRLSLFSLPQHSRGDVREWATNVMMDSSACYAALMAGSGLLSDGETPRLRILVGKQGTHSIFRPVRTRLVPYLVASSRTRASASAILRELRTEHSYVLCAYGAGGGGSGTSSRDDDEDSLPPEGFDGLGCGGGGELGTAVPGNEPVPPEGSDDLYRPCSGSASRGEDEESLPPEGSDDLYRPCSGSASRDEDEESLPPEGLDDLYRPCSGSASANEDEESLPPEGFDDLYRPCSGFPSRDEDEESLPPEGFDDLYRPCSGSASRDEDEESLPP